MKRKNIFYTVLAFTLILTAALLTNCLNPLEGGGGDASVPGGTSTPEGPAFTLPEGTPPEMGAVKFVFKNDARYTILPTVNLDNLRYTVIMTKNDAITANADLPAQLTKAQLEASVIVLDPATYSFELFGETMAGTKIGVLYGKGTEPSYVVPQGGTVTVVIDMKGYTETKNPGTAPTGGTFAYTITFPGGATSTSIAPYEAKISIKSQASPGEVPNPSGDPLTYPLTYTGTTEEAISLPLPAGYYTVTVTAYYTNYKPLTVNFDVLHIYPTLTTSYNFELPLSGEQPMEKEGRKVTVTWNANGKKYGGRFITVPTTWPPVSIDPTLNAWWQNLTWTTSVAGPPVTERIVTGYAVDDKLDQSHIPGDYSNATTTLIFQGWFRNEDGLGAKWNFANDVLWGDQKLWAIWDDQGNAQGGITITFSLAQLLPTGGYLGSHTFVYSKLDSTEDDVTIRLADLSHGDLADLISGPNARLTDPVWYQDTEVFVPTAGTNDDEILDDGWALKLYNRTVSRGNYIPGSYLISLFCKLDGVPVSLSFDIHYDLQN